MNNRTVTVSRGSTTMKVVLSAGKVFIGDQPAELNLRRMTPESVSFALDKLSYTAHCIRLVRLPGGEADVEMLINGCYARFRVSDHRADLLRSMLRVTPGNTGTFEVRAPMPGLVSRIECAPGDPVEQGTGILILEAMKMENEIRSSTTGTVKEIRVRQGQNVEKDELLAVLQSA